MIRWNRSSEIEGNVEGADLRIASEADGWWVRYGEGGARRPTYNDGDSGVLQTTDDKSHYSRGSRAKNGCSVTGVSPGRSRYAFKWKTP